MGIFFLSCAVFSFLIFSDGAWAQQDCNNEHKRDEIVKALNHLVDPRHPHILNATKSFYADMLLYDLQHNHQPQAIPDKRDLKRGAHHLAEKRAHHHDLSHVQHDLDHYKREMMEHMNLICVSQILWELENLLSYPHEVTTHSTPPTSHVTHHRTTTAKTTTTSTTTTKTTSTTHAPTTTVPMLNVSAECDPLSFVRALANGVPLVHPYAGRCTDTTNTQSEALILTTCESPAPTTWKQGLNVMQNCARIPKYTPIATFLFGQYVTDGTSLSGVFLKCTPTGFEMSVQLCGHGPQIFELRSGSGSARQDANSYFIVEY
ncbi:uncharacterized protein LOC111122402 [Crassostrea virginica]